MTAPPVHYAPLGVVESDAPVAALLAALQTLRPAWHMRLVPIESDGKPRYRVEIEQEGLPPADGLIDTWLHIKSALMATFPADKPNAVTAIDP